MFTPWNAVFPVIHLSLGILAIGSGQNSYYRGELIPLRVWPFFEEVSRKAPSTHKEGGAFFTLNRRPLALIISHLS